MQSGKYESNIYNDKISSFDKPFVDVLQIYNGIDIDHTIYTQIGWN